MDWDVFSESDIEALEAAWEIKASGRDLVKYSHEFPEWKKHENELKKFPRCQMYLEDFFLQTAKGSDYCLANKERVQYNLEQFLNMLEL